MNVIPAVKHFCTLTIASVTFNSCLKFDQHAVAYSTHSRRGHKGLRGATRFTRLAKRGACILLVGVHMQVATPLPTHSWKINTAYILLGLIKRIFQDLFVIAFFELNKAVVRLHLEFANVVWSYYYQLCMEELGKVLMRANKLIKGSSKWSYEE